MRIYQCVFSKALSLRFRYCSSAQPVSRKTTLPVIVQLPIPTVMVGAGKIIKVVSCRRAADPVATLPVATQVQIRTAMAGAGKTIRVVLYRRVAVPAVAAVERVAVPRR